MLGTLWSRCVTEPQRVGHRDEAAGFDSFWAASRCTRNGAIYWNARTGLEFVVKWQGYVSRWGKLGCKGKP